MRDILLIIHFIGLAMALGAGFANLSLARVAARLEPGERGTFMGRLMILGRLARIGLGLLVVSGLFLMTPYWSFLSEMPMLIAKLSLVVVLLAIVVAIYVLALKAKRNPALGAKIRPLGVLNFFIGLAIVILAVLAFH